MRILALEFSSNRRSVAVMSPGRQPIEKAATTGERKTEAFHLIEQALAGAALDRADIDCIAVGLGPGSYTGVRAAISIAQAWQLARGTRILGLSSMDALAEQARGEGCAGTVACAIDAQRSEFYVALYQLGNTGKLAEPIHLEKTSELTTRLGAGQVVVGPQPTGNEGRVVFPTASALAVLAMSRTDFLPGEELEPIYLRPPGFVKAAVPRFADA